MINTIIAINDSCLGDILMNQIMRCCPCLNIQTSVRTLHQFKAIFQSEKVDLIIINLKDFHYKELRNLIPNKLLRPEMIYVSDSNIQALDALQSCAAEYLIQPISDENLIIAVERVRERIILRNENIKNQLFARNYLIQNENRFIGIPTMEGFNFFSPNEIIRCEGLQKCTRIITTTKTDIISSYNIGEFRKILEPYNFFLTHKSHLINLTYVKHYLREGSIILKDNSSIPVAKRRKNAFLNQIVHP